MTYVTWIHVIGDPCHIICLSQAVILHPTHGASKDVKFRLSRNSTKFDVVARFRETIPMVIVIRDLEKLWILTEIIILPFFRKLEFSRVLQN